MLAAERELTDFLFQKYLLLFSWVIHNRLFDDMIRQLAVGS
jgi:hypothetical protein